MSFRNKIGNIAKIAKSNPRYFVSWFAGGVGSYAFVGVASYYMQKAGYNPEQIATGTFIAKKIGYYSINMLVHSILHKDRYDVSGKWSSDMKSITKSNLISTGVNTVLSVSLHDLFWMRFMKVGNPLAAFLSYPVGGGISAAVKFHLDTRYGVINNGNNKTGDSGLEEKIK